MVPSRPLAAITGASSGIGAEFARQLASRGYDLLLAARRTDRLEMLCEELVAAHGVRAEAVTADLADAASVDALAARLGAEPVLELLVNNAGFGTLGRFFETEPAGQVNMHMVHVMATMKLTRAVLPGLMERGRGGIINVASVAGFLMMPGNVSYCSTKAWMISFTEGLAIELKGAKSPVRVQALCPGYTLSEFHDVMGVERGSIPRQAWLTNNFVVAESLRGLRRGQLLVIPGWQYKAYVFLLGFLPRWVRHAIAGSYGEKHRAAHRSVARERKL